MILINPYPAAKVSSAKFRLLGLPSGSKVFHMGLWSRTAE